MYIEEAYKGDNAVWKVIITSTICLGVFILNLLAFIFLDIDTEVEMDRMMQLIPNKNALLAINLGIFIPILIALFFLVWALHQRSILSLTTSRKKIDWGRIQFSFWMVFVFTVGTFLIAYYFTPEDYVLQFNAGKFSILFIIGLIMFPFQIGLEEWLFRGYLMQQVGVIVKNKWFPLILTSVMFGIFHSANPEVAELGPITMIFYIGTGLLLGIMTLMDEGLELALGFHFGNNFLAATLVTYEYSALQTDAIYKSVSEPSAGFEIILPVIIVYPIFIFVLAKKYKWSGWKEKLFGKVYPPVIAEESDSLIV